jgi:2-phospho-L-lactate guanylyltransferase (CobY/MobA/RfbA family)
MFSIDVLRFCIGRKMFNYKEALQDIKIEDYIKKPLTCDCSHSPFQYNPSGHVITGDLNIIQHESLRKVISHGTKFRDNIFVMKRGKTLNSFLVFKYRLRSTINTIFEFVNPTLY